MGNEVIAEMKEKMKKSMESFKDDLGRIRTGRASLSLLDGIKVEAYGSPMPLNQVASLTIPESRSLVIQPWDMQLIGAIEKAILKSDLGITPVSDGKVIRITVPQLTGERRKDLVKQVKKISEEYRVAIRNSRRDAIDRLKRQKKNKEVSEDEMFKLQDQAQKETDRYVKEIDDIMAVKEKEVLEV